MNPSTNQLEDSGLNVAAFKPMCEQPDELKLFIRQSVPEKALYPKVMTALEAFEWRHHSIVENIPDIIFSIDGSGLIVTVNNAVNAYGFARAEVLGRPISDLIDSRDREKVAHAFSEILRLGRNQTRTQQFRIHSKSGEIRWLEANSTFRFTKEGCFILQVGVCRDITERIEDQQALLKTKDELEELIFIQTQELTRARIDLQKEIEDRRETEMELLHRELELETEKANLEEANTALKVLLKRREMDKRALEDQVMYNIKKMLLPYVEKLHKKITNERKKAFLSILETNLNDITNSFSRRLSIEFFGLTDAEQKVAHFIRQGKKTQGDGRPVWAYLSEPWKPTGCLFDISCEFVTRKLI